MQDPGCRAALRRPAQPGAYLRGGRRDQLDSEGVRKWHALRAGVQVHRGIQATIERARRKTGSARVDPVARDPLKASALAAATASVSHQALALPRDAAAPHRTDLGPRRRGADRDQALRGGGQREPRPRFRGGALRHRPRRRVAHVLRAGLRGAAGGRRSSVRARQGGAPRGAGGGCGARAAQHRRRRPGRGQVGGLGRRRRRRGLVGVRGSGRGDRDRPRACVVIGARRRALRQPGARRQCAPLRRRLRRHGSP